MSRSGYPADDTGTESSSNRNVGAHQPSLQTVIMFCG